MYATNAATLLNKYQTDSVMTASPIDLIVMLYDALIKQLKLSEMFIAENNIEKANKSLCKAQDIVTELVRGLDFRYPISDELMRIYDFLLAEIAHVNVKKDKEKIRPVLGIVTELRDTWVEVRSQGGRAFTVEE